MAPAIAGLSKEIREDKVIYVVQAGNGYNLAEGDFAGIFVPNIWVEGKQVGGVSLQPDIVKVLTADALAKIADGEKKLRIILPLDITTLTADDKVQIYDSHIDIESGDINQIKYAEQIVVTFSKSLEIVNPVFDGQMYNNTLGLSYDLEMKTKEDSTISKTAGVVTESIEQIEDSTDSLDTKDPMKDLSYTFDIIDRSEIDKMPLEKEYAAGERLHVNANSHLLILFWESTDFLHTSDLLTTDTGAVVFTYPQEIS